MNNYYCRLNSDGTWSVVHSQTGVSVGPFKTRRACLTYLKKTGVSIS